MRALRSSASATRPPSLVGPDIYEHHVFPYEYRLASAIYDMGALVRLHICGNTTALLKRMGEVGAQIIDLDYPSSIDQARRVIPGEQVLLGNIDPVCGCFARAAPT